MAEELGAVIRAWLRENGLEAKFREQSVPDYWVDIVGEKLARHATVERVAHGRMVIRAENPTWKQELLSRRETIRSKVNERFGTEVVREIYVI